MEAKKWLQSSFLLALVALGLAACTKPPCEKELTTPFVVQELPLQKPEKPVPVLNRRAYDLCLLKKNGVQVIQLGQTWTFAFSNDALFDNDTPELLNNTKPLLDVLADFMQTYSTIAVKVTGFSNKPVVEEKNKFGRLIDELTEQQAAAVAEYLVSRHINARLVYAVGRGDHNEIAWSGSHLGRQWNRRTEITFRYYRDNKAWY